MKNERMSFESQAIMFVLARKQSFAPLSASSGLLSDAADSFPIVNISWSLFIVTTLLDMLQV